MTVIQSTGISLDISVPLTTYEIGLLTYMATKNARYSIKGWDDDPESWAAITLTRRGLLEAESTYVYKITETGKALYKFTEEFKTIYETRP